MCVKKRCYKKDDDTAHCTLHGLKSAINVTSEAMSEGETHILRSYKHLTLNSSGASAQ